jgi:hypothetical protein
MPYPVRPCPARPGGAGGHGHDHHTRATCRILHDPTQAGQPALAPVASACGLRAVLGAGAAVAGAIAPIYSLPVGLLYTAAVLALAEVGLYAPGQVSAALGAYVPHGSVTGGSALPDRVHTAVGSGPALPAHGVHCRVAVCIGWDAHCKTAATFVAAAPAATLLAESVVQQI